MDNDTAWCPACDRQIQPKRFQIPVAPLPTTTPPPPPSSPRSKTSGTIRQRAGLVQGTGRVKPNGSLKSKPQPQPQPAPPLRLRTVIDQGPTPLYCSDACQMADIKRGLPHNFNPQRQRSSLTPVTFSSSTTDSDSSNSSIESQSSDESVASATHISPSLATLAALYNFPPLPPPAPVDDDISAPPCPAPAEYSSGVMMAARRIASELGPRPQKRNAYGHITSSIEPRKPIPGWTDGSNAWRSSIYSCTAPDSSTPAPHKSFATRSRSTASVSRTTSTSESDAELLTKFSQSFRRTSRVSTPHSSPTLCASPTSSLRTSSPQKRERSLVHRGAEGKLLVPDVMMRVNSSASSTSLSSEWSATSSRHCRSPLSQASSSGDEEDTTHRCDSTSSLPSKSKRPVETTRSWSYDNIKTYPIMRLPPKTRMETRKETRVVNGKQVEVDVQVEVVVEEKLKRLFLFPAPLASLPA
ncbi:hypothetical protein H0H81_003168 [Sphagnurus paluster]|uniref:Uncharacterized protein n=1 Tax=Sphagnurus paluster TaxID=117069 RepID=A0A9P7GLK6_9AGAR|nr:hypothetical protein H0H81_003168 [Sphagnurus paluster]